MRVFSPAFAAAAGVLTGVLATAGLCAPLSAQEAAPPVSAAAAGDSYMDEEARELVRLARARRATVDRRIEAYDTRALERISVSMRTPLGDRLLFRRETAANIAWTRDTVRIDVVGAREVIPFVRAETQVPAALSATVPTLAFDPVDSSILLRFDNNALRDPLAPGGEQHYRFGAGDSTQLRLPDGRTVRLRELRIVPRRAEPQLISGSFWLDMDTHAVVQVFIRPARGYDSRRDGGSTLIPTGIEFEYIAIDYGFWDLRWWLPRVVAAHGVMRASGVRMPVTYERRYENYTVVGDTVMVPLAAEGDTVGARLCRPPVSFSISVRPGPGVLDTASAETAARVQAAADSARDARRAERMAEPGDTSTVCDRAFLVTRVDAAELLTSELLPADIYGGDSPAVEAEELRAIAERMRSVAPSPWQLAAPSFEWPLNQPGLLRYNRVEGLSAAVRAGLVLGPVSADAAVRFGTAGEFGAAAGVSRSGTRLDSRIEAYRRLDAVDVAAAPFALRTSLRGLLLGRDDHDYFRASGAELLLRPAESRSQWYDLRLFAERQAAVAEHTDFSVASLIGSNRDMRPNIMADPADQAGATLRLRASHGLNPAAPRWGGELVLHGEAGDYQFVRPSVEVRGSVPVGRLLTFGAGAAGGTGFGDVPLQRYWQIGGVGTLRGYDAAAARGDTFWRGRGEAAFGMPYTRLVLFSDVGWAGPRDELQQGRALSSVGAGFSLLDGLLRVDLARATQTRNWKLHLHFGGVL
jgi:hypothetical protein